MGRKGVSKRKPKQSNTISKDKAGIPSNTRLGEISPVQSLIKNNEAAHNRGNLNTTNGSKHKNKKGK